MVLYHSAITFLQLIDLLIFAIIQYNTVTANARLSCLIQIDQICVEIPDFFVTLKIPIEGNSE